MISNAKHTKILVVDVGGTHIKLLVSGSRSPIRIPSGITMTPQEMVAAVIAATASAGWTYSKISMGFPGPVVHGKPVSEPHNLGSGWVGFDFHKAFGRPVRMMNDAAMQAIGS
jgi:predicted NBD/HSP70 family sugar kinase